MEYTKESIEIKNNIKTYPFRLELDDIKGYIRLTKNTDNETTRITTRNIPIKETIKWAFHRARDKYCIKKDGDDFTGSAIFKSINPSKYDKWKKFILIGYKELKEENEK